MRSSFKINNRSFFISVFISFFFLASLAVAVVAQEKEAGLKVTIFIFSGRPNPTYMIEKQDQVDKLRTLFEASKTDEKFEKSTVIPSILGYNGVIIENQTNVPGLPPYLAVYKGTIEAKNEKKRFLIDEGGKLEDFLVNEALKRGLIDERALKFIK